MGQKEGHKMEKKKRTEEAIFWSKVAIKSPEECWNWTGYIEKKGYGRLRYKKTLILAHRLAWELHYNQKVPETLCICHSCDNPACCNHSHLFCGTNADNMRDKAIKGRARKNSSSKDEDLPIIKKLWKSKNFTQEQIGKLFDVSKDVTGRNKYTRGSRYV